MGSDGSDRPEAVESDVGRLEVPRGSPRRLGWGLAARDGLDPTPWWYGTDRDHLGRQGQPQSRQVRLGKSPASRAAKFLGGQLDGHSPVYCVFYWFFLRAASYWASKSLAAAPYTSISRKRRRLRNLLEL